MAEDDPDKTDLSHPEAKRFFLQYQPNWDELTEEEQEEARLQMALEVQRQPGRAD